MKMTAWGRLAVAAALTLGVSAQANAAVISVDGANAVDIPGLTGFTTNGAMMSGLSVTAYFLNATPETLAWQTTGADSGGVTGTGWSLNQSGDTFGGDWNFANTGGGLLTRLVLNGATGLTVFDKSVAGAGSPGSENGLNWVSTLGGDGSIQVTYRIPVGIAGAAPAGDLFHIIDVDFTGMANGGTRESFSFDQDSDNDSRFASPEPSVMALFGLGLLGAARVRRRHS
jgi:hypothetical protein